VYLESSKDILFLVLAFCALWFTAFVCWALYYVITILRDASNAVAEIRDRIAAIDEAVRMVREKVENSLGSFGIAASGFKMLSSYLAKRKEKAEEKAERVVEKVKKKMSKAKRKLMEELEEESEDLM
jgi:biopolymer transport protein ExbB/TolQ